MCKAYLILSLLTSTVKITNGVYSSGAQEGRENVGDSRAIEYGANF